LKKQFALSKENGGDPQSISGSTSFSESHALADRIAALTDRLGFNTLRFL
jgi:hypothetical protein